MFLKHTVKKNKISRENEISAYLDREISEEEIIIIEGKLLASKKYRNELNKYEIIRN